MLPKENHTTSLKAFGKDHEKEREIASDVDAVILENVETLTVNACQSQIRWGMFY